jgi:hypothetical protein
MDTAVFIGLERGDKIVMLEPAGCLELASETHDGLAVAGERRGKDLERAESTEFAMTGHKNFSHPTLAQLVEDEIVADQEAATLFLVDRGGLIGSKLAGVHEGT